MLKAMATQLFGVAGRDQDLVHYPYAVSQPAEYVLRIRAGQLSSHTDRFIPKLGEENAATFCQLEGRLIC